MFNLLMEFQVVVLYAGEPNLRCTDPLQVSEGTVAAVKAIRDKQPNAFILVQVKSQNHTCQIKNITNSP